MAAPRDNDQAPATRDDVRVLPDRSLCPRLRGMVDPQVLAERRAAVEARASDRSRDRTLRRRAAKIVAEALIESLEGE